MSSLKRSVSLYASRSQRSNIPTNSKAKNENLRDINEMTPSNLIKNKFKSCLDTSLNMNLSISDCTCPICLEVLVEPVKMPCSHEVCLPCFKAMIDQTNFLCPMCRMRISTWSRNASNNNTLVNTERWEQIKRAFPSEIQNRIEGKTAMLLAQSMANAATSKKVAEESQTREGEIRREYQETLRQEEQRLRLEKENEEKESLKLIQELLRNEENISLGDYINAVSSNDSQTPTTSQSTASNRLVKNVHRQENQRTLLTRSGSLRPVLSAQTAKTIHNNHNKSQNTTHMPVIATHQPSVKSMIQKINDSSKLATPLTSIASSIKLNPRNSIKRTQEQVKSLRERLGTINYVENADESVQLIDESRHNNTSTIKKRLRSCLNNEDEDESILSGSAPSTSRSSQSDTTLPRTSGTSNSRRINAISNNNNNSCSSNDESTDSSMISSMSSMSLRKRKV